MKNSAYMEHKYSDYSAGLNAFKNFSFVSLSQRELDLARYSLANRDERLSVFNFICSSYNRAQVSVVSVS